MPDLRLFGSTSNIVRFTLKDKTTGQGKQGISSATTGLIISTITDNEATPTVYTSTNLEAVTTLGTYSAPTSGKARIKKVDDTNNPGLVEIQLADARFAVSSSKRLVISVNDAQSTLLDTDYEIELVRFDPFTAFVTTTDILYTALTETYAADGAAFTLAQGLYEICQLLEERNLSGTTMTVKKRDGSTSAMTFTLNSATTPTTQTRAT